MHAVRGNDFHVPVAARDRDAAGTNRVAFLGFADAKIAALVEALGQ